MRFYLKKHIKKLSQYTYTDLDPLKMRTPCNGDFFTPKSVNRIRGQTDARC